VVAPGSPASDLLHHPAFAPPHALPLIAAGLWAGQTGGRAGWALLAALIAGTAAGIGLVWLDTPPPFRAPGTFAAMIVFGGLCAAALRPPWWVAMALGALAGIWQGALGSVPPFRGGTGDWTADQMMVAAILWPLAAWQLGLRAGAARTGWPAIVVRVAASWIAASGILLLAFTLRL
jgi:urease accessory protein